MTAPAFLTQTLVSQRAFGDHPFRVVDVGAVGGAESHWSTYGDQLHLVGFEPDEAECARLNELHGGRHTYVPVALDRVARKRDLHLTRFGQASSFLLPDTAWLEQFGQVSTGTVISTKSVETTTLDRWLTDEKIDYVDFLKLDVEGVELDVLEGAENVLPTILGLSIETFFQPYHQGRALFADVDSYMRAHHFVLMDVLMIDRWRRRAVSLPVWSPGDDLPYEWFGGGQAIMAQVLYTRDPRDFEKTGNDTSLARRKILKAASMFEVFGLADVTVQVIDQARRANVLEAPTANTYRNMAVRSATQQWKGSASLKSRTVGKSRRLVKAALPESVKPTAKRLYLRLKRR